MARFARDQGHTHRVVVEWLSVALFVIAAAITLLVLFDCGPARAQQAAALPVPALYKMFDYGTDYQRLHPEYGAVGSYQWFLWEDVHTGPGEFDWTLVDQRLHEEKGLEVTLADGTEVDKPILLLGCSFISSGPSGWPVMFYDGTPRWVYERMGNRSEIGGHLVGHILDGCGLQAVVPAFESTIWRDAWIEFVQAFGERYDGRRQLSVVVIATGLDGETQMVKNWGCDWAAEAAKVPGLGSGFGKVVEQTVAAFADAFPNTPTYLANAPGGSGMREWTGSLASAYGVGMKNNAGQTDNDSHRGYGDYWGLWDPPRVYSDTVPIWAETWSGLGDAETRYWTFAAMLHYHPDAISVHPEFLTQSDPEWLAWVGRHMGVTIQQSPSVWTIMRDAEFPRVDWGPGGVSGHPGDWTFWLYRIDAPGSYAPRVWRDDMPTAKNDYRSRQCRRTDEAIGNGWISFDVDDNYSGDDWAMGVVILNHGTDTFAIEYADALGRVRTLPFSKGEWLGPPDEWVEVYTTLPGAEMGGALAGGADLRLSSEGDGDEYLHMAIVFRDWIGPTATPVACVTPSPTVTRTPTRMTTSTRTRIPTPTATATFVPTVAWFAAEAGEINDLAARVSALETEVAGLLE